MSFLKKTFGLLAIFSVIPVAYAATARPGTTSANSRVGIVSTTASRRMPTMTTYLNSAIAGTGVGGNTITGSIAGSGVLDDEECRTSYDECIRDPEVCGPDFEECTTNILFHAQMPKCTNILMQCGASGINSLFGTSNIGALSTVAEYLKDAKGNEIEVKRYTYPIDSSVMGMAIIGGMHANQFPDSATCSKRYISCLNRDTVCGADFELCTSKSEFKKQSLQCESTLARCTADGVMSLFNVKQWTEKGTIDSGSVIGEMITAGADLAANNAVNTCYRVADQCFSAACANNPLRCIAGKSQSVINSADGLAGGSAVSNGTVARTFDGTDYEDKIWSASDVNKFLGAACRDTIGANKYCQMTAMGKTPSKKELQDIDVQEEVFAEILNLRKSTFESNLTGLLQEFDTDAKNKCSETIKSCAMRTCGGGYGSLCWAQVYGDGKEGSVATADSAQLKEITVGCSAIVNADPYCIYAYQSGADKGAFGYSYYDGDVFDELFSDDDPLGVVAALNASLQSSYDASSIANMKKQCEGVAISCVKTMCGDKYENCYRNRSDVVLDRSYVTTNSEVFDKSMNKVGGVLDTVVVLGLCLNTVKNSPICEEHLLITSQKYTADNYEQLWGQSGETRSAWLAAGQNTEKFANPEVQETNDKGEELCYDPANNKGPCGQMNSDTKQVYDTNKPVMTTVQEYAINKSATGIFQNLLADMELEAQAIYNSELVAEQSACYAANGGGVSNSSAATYMWAKLNSTADISNSLLKGFASADFTPSNDLYESYCRVRVNLTSKDTKINNILLSNEATNWNARYFVVGDAFTCGSWIPTDTLRDKILEQVKDANKKKDARTRALAYVLGPMASVGLGAFVGTETQKGNILGGLTGAGEKEKATNIRKRQFNVKVTAGKNCIKELEKMGAGVSNATLKSYANKAIDYADEAEIDVSKYRKKVKSVSATSTDTGVLSKLEDALAGLEDECKEWKDREGDFDEYDDPDGMSEADDKAKGAAWAMGAATTVAGIGVTAMATETALSAQKDEEVQAIMDELNEKIRCTIGGVDVGGYGDIIPVMFD